MSFTISGIGSCLPQRSISNDDLTAFLDTSDEWISTRTGIRSRAVMTGEETVTSLAVQAAREALADSRVSPGELDVIICATITPDYITPSLACMVQAEIGASCPAFDVSAACSGFVYALDTADGWFVRGRAKKALVICAEGLSRAVDWTDRSTCVLFGDGAAAVVLEEGDGLLSIRLTASGNCPVLNIPHISGNAPFERSGREQPYLKMNGQEVYKFAVNALCTDALAVAEQAGLEMGQIDFLIPHQANLRIIETARRKLGFPPEKTIVNIDHTGNTSAASAPLALAEAVKAGKIRNGDILLFTTFGGGLTTGACILRWNHGKKELSC